jgi:hypothetical protein
MNRRTLMNNQTHYRHGHHHEPVTLTLLQTSHPVEEEEVYVFQVKSKTPTKIHIARTIQTTCHRTTSSKKWTDMPMRSTTTVLYEGRRTHLLAASKYKSATKTLACRAPTLHALQNNAQLL